MMSDPNNLIQHFQNLLQKKSDPGVKSWWENYVKGAHFRGVKMAEIRKTVKQWREEYGIDQNEPMMQFDLGVGMMRQSFTEDKMGGILLIQEHINRKGLVPWQIQMEPYSNLFRQNHLADWNIVDWFCVKVMSDLAKNYPIDIFEATDPWKSSDYLWQRRSAVVSFVNHAKLGDSFFVGFFKNLLARCDHLLVSKERFIQTGTGWVLRELSKYDPSAIFDYLDENRTKFTPEGMRYASEKLSNSEKIKLRN